MMTTSIQSNVTDVFVLVLVALLGGRESECQSGVYRGALPATPKRGGSLSL